MTEGNDRRPDPRVLVLADVASNAPGIIERTLEPAGIRAWPQGDPEAPTPDVLVVDVTQLRGDPLASLRTQRSQGVEAPAIVLAAHFPTARLRDLFRLGVADILLKPYKGVDLCKAIYELSEARSDEVTTQLLARRLQSSREQARRRSEEIRWLSEIGRTVVHLRDLDDILTRVVEAAAFLTDAEEANIYLVDAKSNEVILRASRSAGESRGTLKSLRITDTLAGEVYRTGEPVIRQPNVESEKVKVQTGFLVQSLIKVPVRIGDQVVGVLGVYNRLAPRSFSDHHITLLSALADWAGVALEQAAKGGLREAPEPPAPAPAQSPEPPAATTRVPPDLIKGFDHLQRRIGSMLESGDDGMSPAVRERLRSLREEVEQLSRLPMAVLEPEVVHTFIDLQNLASRVVEELQMAARQRQLELAFDGDEPAPRLRGDRNRAHRVIEALTAAAIRRTRKGRVNLELRTFEVQRGQSSQYPLPVEAALSDGLWVAVRVSDSSGGLSPDTLRALSSTKPDPEAGKLGPGLSMGEVRMIAESMGGKLWHEHTPMSTTITFALPAR